METQTWKLPVIILALGVIFFGLLALLSVDAPRVAADAYSSTRVLPLGALVDSPTITIAGATASTGATSTTGVHRADLTWKFGTVTGSYATCTVQAQTTFDGATWLTLGSAAAVTATSNTENSWAVIEQLGTTTVTTSTPASGTALSFGEQTRWNFSCTSYGTSAPVTIDVLYK